MTNAPNIALDNFVERVELGNIFFDSFSARLRQLKHVENLAIEVVTSYASTSDRVLYRFVVQCELQGPLRDAPSEASQSKTGDRPELAKLDLAVVCEYLVPEDFTPLDEELIETFGDAIALQMAYPYIREAVSSMVTRLGFPAITIGLMPDGKRIPKAVWGRRPE